MYAYVYVVLNCLCCLLLLCVVLFSFVGLYLLVLCRLGLRACGELEVADLSKLLLELLASLWVCLSC